MAQAPVVQQHALTPGPQWNWDNLQDWSQQAAPSVQLSRLKEHIASLNVTLLEADNGASIVAATGAAHAKESVTDTLDRRYSRAYGQVGVRMSLLAAAEERQRAVSQARGALQTEAAQRRLLQMQSVTELGACMCATCVVSSVSRWWRSSCAVSRKQQASLGAGWLKG